MSKNLAHHADRIALSHPRDGQGEKLLKLVIEILYLYYRSASSPSSAEEHATKSDFVHLPWIQRAETLLSH